MNNVTNFKKILFSTYPELYGLVHIEVNYRICNIGLSYFEHIEQPIYRPQNYNICEIRLEFPSRYRNKIYSLIKFCGLKMLHEFTDNAEEKTIFESDIIFC